jgi:hypothetical protein
MGRLLHRFFYASLGVAFLASSGCLQIPFFIPELNYVPGVDARCPSTEVHAFRVDITQTMEIKESVSSGLRGETIDHQEFARIHASPQGATMPQLGVTGAYGWRYVGFVNYCSANTGHAIGMRFYRAGYETIVLKPGESMRELDWKKAPDLYAQTKAVDDLVSAGEGIVTGASSVRSVLDPGSRSVAHHEALLFAASEYDRLANFAEADDPEMHTRLVESATRLRALAGKK